MEHRLKRQIRLYWGFQTFHSLLVWMPVFYEAQRRLGLTDTQIFSIQSIYYLAFCFLEIPTGWLADRWGRRTCMAVGAGLLTLSNLLPAFLPAYAGFLGHFLLLALARSFVSGAASAWLYDGLAAANEAPRFKSVEGTARSLGLVAKIACWPLAGALLEAHVLLPYFLTAAASAAGLGFALMMPEQGAPAHLGGAPVGLGQLARVLKSSPFLVLLMLQGVGVFVLGRIVQVNLFQPILTDKGLSLATHGGIMALMTVFEALGSFRPGWVRRWFDDINATTALTIGMAVALLAIPLSGGAGTIVMLSVFSYVMGLSYPVQKQLFNDAIPDSRFRATLLSVESIVDRGANAAVAAMLASFVAAGRVTEFLQIAGVFSLGMVAVVHFGIRLTRSGARELAT